MKKLMLALAVTAGAMTAAPQPAHAECAADYAKCLNDTWYYSGMLKKMADVSCFAAYVGCLRNAVTGR